ncbi:MAG: HD domain-containing protein [Gammaproteobacteria bacterium]
MRNEDAFVRVKDLYERYGKNHYGENVTQTQHAIQCGRLARLDNQSDEVVIAAFLHDIGHLVLHETPEEDRDDVIYRHQLVGANLLRSLGFSEMVADLVEKHVAGKRYLTAVDGAYYATLSDASKESLAFQGGPMNADEVAAFEAEPNKDLHIRLRHWDDLAKDSDDPETNMGDYMELIRLHLRA